MYYLASVHADANMAIFIIIKLLQSVLVNYTIHIIINNAYSYRLYNYMPYMGSHGYHSNKEYLN